MPIARKGTNWQEFITLDYEEITFHFMPFYLGELDRTGAMQFPDR